jgi:DNA-binding protein H-NS
MKISDLKSLPLDELWDFHEEVVETLAAKMTAEKSVLEERLRKLINPQIQADQISKVRQPYPPVVPKYRNPNEPSETWSGRGKQPRWLVAALKSGKRIGDFQI